MLQGGGIRIKGGSGLKAQGLGFGAYVLENLKEQLLKPS